MYGKAMAPAKSSSKKPAAFKPCKGCPNPAKCAKMGMCMMKGAKK